MIPRKASLSGSFFMFSFYEKIGERKQIFLHAGEDLLAVFQLLKSRINDFVIIREPALGK